MTKAEKDLYTTLIWATMAINMDKITEENAEEFAFRTNFLEITNRYVTVDEVKTFAGLTTNATKLTTKQWQTKVKKFWYQDKAAEVEEKMKGGES